jgi:hypothetical protein
MILWACYLSLEDLVDREVDGLVAALAKGGGHHPLVESADALLLGDERRRLYHIPAYHSANPGHSMQWTR